MDRNEEIKQHTRHLVQTLRREDVTEEQAMVALTAAIDGVVTSTLDAVHLLVEKRIEVVENSYQDDSLAGALIRRHVLSQLRHLGGELYQVRQAWLDDRS